MDVRNLTSFSKDNLSAGQTYAAGVKFLMIQNLFFNLYIMVNNHTKQIFTNLIGEEGGKANTAKMIGSVELIDTSFDYAGEGVAIAGELALLKGGKNYIQVPFGTLAENSLKAPTDIK